MPRIGGVVLHRSDLEGWQSTIWVDCMALDGPFLVRLWRETGERRWLELGLEHATGYVAALQDPATGLFWHGYDAAPGVTTGQLWGRGNGWALLGLLETLEFTPPERPEYARLRRSLATLTRALVEHQDSSGAWRTVLVDPTAPLENSTAPFVSAGLMWASRLGLLRGVLEPDTIKRVVERAFHHLTGALGPDGSLPISAATPIGGLTTYTEQRLGVFPWGQGPALLAIAEATRLRS
jgi:unsaturated rhamnogalacturonyl hydrolase